MSVEECATGLASAESGTTPPSSLQPQAAGTSKRRIGLQRLAEKSLRVSEAGPLDALTQVR